MRLHLVAHFRGNLRLGNDAKTVRHTVGSLQYLGDVTCDFCEGQVFAVDALDADRFAILADSPDVPSEVAPGLAVPFERSPSIGPPVISKYESLEFGAVQILEMDRMHGCGGFLHI